MTPPSTGAGPPEYAKGDPRRPLALQYLPSIAVHSSGEKVVTWPLVSEIALGQLSTESPGQTNFPPDPVTPAVPPDVPALPVVPALPPAPGLPVPAVPVRMPPSPPQFAKKTANESAPPIPTSADNLTTLAKPFRMLDGPFAIMRGF
jgi:hypothetical protein